MFKKFGFGNRLSSVIVFQIYPIEGFLDADGKPEVRIRLDLEAVRRSRFILIF
ncbi:MAG: hypothetical protein V7K39_05885 [Nostoc sp.]